MKSWCPVKTRRRYLTALKLDYIPPELREDRGEIEAAEKHLLPRLVEEQDIRGTFHAHTTHSDGTCSLQELIHAAQQLGYTYLGITEHSQSVSYARGLKPDQLIELFREIDAINKKLKGFRVFKGTEADILADGTLDYDAELLALCDFVIASVHSHFTQSQAEITGRIITALAEPLCHHARPSHGAAALVARALRGGHDESYRRGIPGRNALLK